MENLTPNNLYSALRQCRAYVTRFSSLDFEFIQRSEEEVNLGTLSFELGLPGPVTVGRETEECAASCVANTALATLL